jgi:hypothetical protein
MPVNKFFSPSLIIRIISIHVVLVPPPLPHKKKKKKKKKKKT